VLELIPDPLRKRIAPFWSSVSCTGRERMDCVIQSVVWQRLMASSNGMSLLVPGLVTRVQSLPLRAQIAKL